LETLGFTKTGWSLSADDLHEGEREREARRKKEGEREGGERGRGEGERGRGGERRVNVRGKPPSLTPEP
jgi:hypothetical protein